MKKYNCAFTVAFTVPNCDDPNGDTVTDLDFIIALNRRIADLVETGTLSEAIGAAFDSYEETTES